MMKIIVKIASFREKLGHPLECACCQNPIQITKDTNPFLYFCDCSKQSQLTGLCHKCSNACKQITQCQRCKKDLCLTNPVNKLIDISKFEIMCPIICIDVERLQDLIVYDECFHSFCRDAIQMSCQEMLN